MVVVGIIIMIEVVGAIATDKTTIVVVIAKVVCDWYVNSGLQQQWWL